MCFQQRKHFFTLTKNQKQKQCQKHWIIINYFYDKKIKLLRFFSIRQNWIMDFIRPTCQVIAEFKTEKCWNFHFVLKCHQNNILKYFHLESILQNNVFEVNRDVCLLPYFLFQIYDSEIRAFAFPCTCGCPFFWRLAVQGFTSVPINFYSDVKLQTHFTYFDKCLSFFSEGFISAMGWFNKISQANVFFTFKDVWSFWTSLVIVIAVVRAWHCNIFQLIWNFWIICKLFRPESLNSHNFISF